MQADITHLIDAYADLYRSKGLEHIEADFLRVAKGQITELWSVQTRQAKP